MDELLNGTNPDADTALMLAVQTAMLPDPYDGVPADVTADPAHGGRGGTMGDAAAALHVTRSETLMESSYRSGRERGIVDATVWLRAHGYGEAASALIRAETEISSRF